MFALAEFRTSGPSGRTSGSFFLYISKSFRETSLYFMLVLGCPLLFLLDFVFLVSRRLTCFLWINAGAFSLVLYHPSEKTMCFFLLVRFPVLVFVSTERKAYIF